VYLLSHTYTTFNSNSLRYRCVRSLLITFRLNFAYGRYSEGATTVYGMISKFLDCAMILVSRFRN
jgi:hypothetical protein